MATVGTPAVTVIVPAYNAAATIEETLQSVAEQTFPDWTMLIIDDGSTDATAAIARRFCAGEPRARLITQANGGVARARNRGLAEARSRWIAPVDADDIWHPTHLSLLVALAQSAGPEPALVFAQSRHIDARSNILLSPEPRLVAGPALALMAMRNIVGNGSALLLDRAAALAVGGYDPRLRDAGCEGCEDYLLQLRLAARHPVVAAPHYTVGFRQLPSGMSKRVEAMHASQQMARELLLADEPAAAAVPSRFWRRALADSRLTLSRDRMRRGRMIAAAAALAGAFAADPGGSLIIVASDARRVLARLVGFGRGRKPRYRHFRDVPPEEMGTAMFDPPVRTGILSAMQRRRQGDALAVSATLAPDGARILTRAVRGHHLIGK